MRTQSGLVSSARTGQSGRFARFVKKAPLVLSKHLWIWPLFGAVLMSLVGLWTRSLVEGTMKAELASRMQTLLQVNTSALRMWLAEKESDAKALAADLTVQEAALELAALAEAPNATEQSLLESEPAKALETHLKPLLEAQIYRDYVIISRDRRALASTIPGMVNRTVPSGFDPFVRRALSGPALVSRPFWPDGVPTPGNPPPFMFTAAPIRSADGAIVAVLALRMSPAEDFSKILSVTRVGETGEAYAFDSRGVMLTTSRFTDELKAMGLITNAPGSSSILSVQLLDPGADLTEGENAQPRHQLPLTRAAASATIEWDGYDAEGYRNYRGVEVIGAWAWLPDYGMGVIVETATEEAFQTLYVLRRVFFSLFLLLVFSGIAIFVFSLLVERLESSVRKGALATRRLGQYVLVQEIGRGSTGMVYRARHAFLRRPVAVKILSPELTNEASVARFEHEVQMTSQLAHPNTVAIYDYGRTPEGLFYYAMEYLRGITLHRLVREHGRQPAARIVNILRQVCGSIAEAHSIGLIHRDVKPANIVLTRRGQLCDVVKVLDFGLVKAVNLTTRGLAPDAVVGTPHFMSPEAIGDPENIDGRTDIYSIGAVGYWLLTGKTLFDSENVDKLLERQTGEEPLHPSVVLKGTRSADLQEIIMRCLAKNPDERPRSADELDQALARCVVSDTWTVAQAEEWWRKNLGGIESVPSATMPEKTLIIEPR
jgi:tRNA A-37 threonylcarbamoyl transferase component Bud32